MSYFCSMCLCDHTTIDGCLIKCITPGICEVCEVGEPITASDTPSELE